MLEDLPEELFFHVASKYLCVEDVARLSCASKTLNRRCGNDIWKALFFRMQSMDKDTYIITNKSQHQKDYGCICYYECKRYKDMQDGGNYTYGDWLDDDRPCFIPNHYVRSTLITVPGNYDRRPYKNYKKRIATLFRTKLGNIPLELEDASMKRKMQEILNTQDQLSKMLTQYHRLSRAKLKWKIKHCSLEYYIGREQKLRKKKRPVNQVSVVV